MNSRIAIGSALKYYHKRFFVSLVYFLCSYFIFFTLGFSAYAATYYVDYSTGTDTNNGTSTSAPWQHCPGDPRATNKANIILSSGDTIVFKGGLHIHLVSRQKIILLPMPAAVMGVS